MSQPTNALELPPGVIALIPMRNLLPVGGIKEKVLAAQRAGLHTVLLPERNLKDLREVPESTRTEMRFIGLQTVDDAIRAALADTGMPRA